MSRARGIPRPPRAGDGELKAKWGTSRDGGNDLHYSWGVGVSKSDARLLHNLLSSPQWPGPLTVAEYLDSGGHIFSLPHHPSLLDQLAARGYDLTTLRITVRKRAQDGNP